MKNLSKAIRITSQVFEDKLDRGGNPYILHCLHVMNEVKHLGEEAMISAVMHDVIEDTEVTFDDLYNEGFSQEVLLILQLLTHRKGTDYMAYIKALSVHPIAKEIKKADLRHNSDITRLKGVRQKDFDRLEKYSRAYLYLTD